MKGGLWKRTLFWDSRRLLRGQSVSFPASLPELYKPLKYWTSFPQTDHYHHLHTPCDTHCSFVSSTQRHFLFRYFPSHLVTRRRRQRPSAKLLFAPLYLFQCFHSLLVSPYLPSLSVDWFVLSFLLVLSHLPGHTSPQRHFTSAFIIARLADCLSHCYLPSCYRSVLVLHSSLVSSTTTTLSSSKQFAHLISVFSSTTATDPIKVRKLDNLKVALGRDKCISQKSADKHVILRHFHPFHGTWICTNRFVQILILLLLVQLNNNFTAKSISGNAYQDCTHTTSVAISSLKQCCCIFFILLLFSEAVCRWRWYPMTGLNRQIISARFLAANSIIPCHNSFNRVLSLRIHHTWRRWAAYQNIESGPFKASSYRAVFVRWKQLESLAVVMSSPVDLDYISLG